MSTDPKVQQIFTTIEQLREAAGDGPRTRKLLDALFRSIHNLKARASANGLNSLAAAAHEFENVLQLLRTADSAFDSNALPAEIWNSLKQEQKHAVQRSLAEGARLLLVHADFEIAHFDRQFRSLKETLDQNGEVISTTPRVEEEGSQKVNFRILYAQPAEQALPELSDVAAVRIEDISTPLAATPQAPVGQAQQITSGIERAFEKLSDELARLKPISTGNILDQAVQAGRAAAAVTGKDVDFEIRGEEIFSEEISNALADPLLHLVRNAVDHGIETSDERVNLGKARRGKVIIEARNPGDEILITVTDDGRGIDPGIIEQIFRPGFSTAREISTISGRGVGLDAVQTTIAELGGSISVTSEPGKGSSFHIKLPRS